MRKLTDKQFFGDIQFYKKALVIGIPVMFQSLIQSLVSLIDSFMVSGLGDIKMSGVNISGQILFIFMIYYRAQFVHPVVFFLHSFPEQRIRRGCNSHLHLRL
jgi:Na+-driven multidrug efflux pump